MVKRACKLPIALILPFQSSKLLTNCSSCMEGGLNLLRWSYVRNAEMILYFFYKNMLFTIPQFFFVFMNAYSGLSLFNSW